MLIPVIQILKKEKDFELTVLGLTTASNNLQRAGIEHIGFRHLVERGDEPALEIGRKMVEELGDKIKVDREETIAYLGLSYKDMIDRLGEEEAARQYRERGRQAFLPLTIMERALRRFRPDLVVATNSPRAEKAAILTAGKLGIPSVCVVDLFDPREFEDRIGKPGYATRVCVFSEFARQDLLKMGRKPEEVVVTGNPGFDELVDGDLPARAQRMIEERGWANRKRILWARSVEPRDWDLYQQTEAALMDMAHRHQDWQVILRLHPNDPTSLGNLPKRVDQSTQADPLPVLLTSCDVVITTNSTVGLQGAVIGKPVITMDQGFTSSFTQYSQKGISYGVDRVEDLERAIENVLDGNYTPCDRLPKPGGSVHKVVEVIKGLL